MDIQNIYFVEKHFRNTFLDKDSDYEAVMIGGLESAIAERECFFVWCETMGFPTAMVSIYSAKVDGCDRLAHDKLISTVYWNKDGRKEEKKNV